MCVCVVGTAEEGQYDPCRIQGPTQEVLERSGSEIQDGQLENERGGKGTGVASFVNPGCFFSLDMCLLFTYAVEGGGFFEAGSGFLLEIRLYTSPQ